MIHNLELLKVRKMTHSINKSPFELEKSISIGIHYFLSTNKSVFI